EQITAELATTAAAEAKPFANVQTTERPLRIGFISRDFRDHPVAHYFHPLLAQHDRKNFEFYCYTEQERTDQYTPILQQTGGTWRMASILAPDTTLRQQ